MRYGLADQKPPLRPGKSSAKKYANSMFSVREKQSEWCEVFTAVEAGLRAMNTEKNLTSGSRLGQPQLPIS
jgi:hypothetical protein